MAKWRENSNQTTLQSRPADFWGKSGFNASQLQVRQTYGSHFEDEEWKSEVWKTAQLREPQRLSLSHH